MKTSYLLSAFLLFFFVGYAPGQNPQGDANQRQQQEQARMAAEENAERAVREAQRRTVNEAFDRMTLGGNRTTISAFPTDINLSNRDKILLFPSPEFLTKYENFLGQPKTGLIKLLADNCAEANGNVKNPAACDTNTIPERGSAYSFRRNEYQWRDWADLRLVDGNFVNNILFGQGWLVSLGDVKIEDVSPATEGADALFAIVPAPTLPLAEIQRRESVEGIDTNQFLYRKFLPVVENNTYLLRSVAYRGKFKEEKVYGVIDMTRGDTRVDVIIALRVLKKEPDGTVTLIWKELSRKDSPKIEIKSDDQIKE